MYTVLHRMVLASFLLAGNLNTASGDLPAGELGKAPANGQATCSDRYGDPLPQGAVARLGTVRLRHPDRIDSLVFSNDGRFIIAGIDFGFRSYGNLDQPLYSIWIWESRTGKLVRRIGNPKTRVFKLCLSPDGKTIISSDWNGVELWDITTGKRICRVVNTKKKGEVATMSLSSDGKTLAVHVLNSGKIHIWDMRKIERLRSFDSGDDPVLDLALSPDGTILASSHVSQGVLWDTTTGKALHQFRPVFQAKAVFSPDGKTIAVEEVRGTVQLRDAVSGKQLQPSKTSPIRSGTWKGTAPYAFSPNGKTLAITTSAGDVRLCDLANGNTIWEHKSVYTPLSSYAFSPDGKLLAVGDGNGLLRLLDVSTGKNIHSFAGHNKDVWSVAYVRDGGFVSAGIDRTVRSWNARTGQEIKVLCRMDTDAQTIVASPSGKVLAVSSFDGVIRLLGWPSGKAIRSLRGHGGFTAMQFSPDSKVLAGGMEASISLWNIATGKELCELKRYTGAKGVNCLVFSSDGKLLATDNRDSSIEIWDVMGKKLIRTLDGHEKDVPSVVFTSTRKYLISRSRDFFMLRMWNVDGGQETMRFPLDPDKAPTITALALSEDRRVLASGEWSDDGIIVRLWEVASGREICHFHGHTNEIRTLAFSPDGRTVASGSRDCTILVWDVFGLVLKPKVLDPKLSTENLEALWRMLCDRDLRLVYRAVREMANAPNEAIPFLRKRLRAVPVNSVECLSGWVRDLDSDDFITRQKAFTSLEAAAEQAEPILRKALTTRPSLELRRRIEELLKTLSALNLSPNRLREGRALTVLELIRTPTAKNTLELIGRGDPGAWLTQEANATLQRLNVQRGFPDSR